MYAQRLALTIVADVRRERRGGGHAVVYVCAQKRPEQVGASILRELSTHTSHVKAGERGGLADLHEESRQMLRMEVSFAGVPFHRPLESLDAG